jgi:hypothetical protein
VYKVTRGRRTGLTVPRDVGSSPQGSPPALASAGGRRGQRFNLFGGRWRTVQLLHVVNIDGGFSPGATGHRELLLL